MKNPDPRGKIDGEEVEIVVTHITCEQCKETHGVHGADDGDRFVGEHGGHLLTYRGIIMEPSGFAGHEITFQLVAPGSNVH